MVPQQHCAKKKKKKKRKAVCGSVTNPSLISLIKGTDGEESPEKPLITVTYYENICLSPTNPLYSTMKLYNALPLPPSCHQQMFLNSSTNENDINVYEKLTGIISWFNK